MKDNFGTGALPTPTPQSESLIAVPGHIAAEQNAKTESQLDEQFVAQMPIPTGFRLLIALPDAEQTFDGSVIEKTEAQKKRDYITSILGIVVDMGPDAYQDKKRYPNGPWCKEGDYIIFRMNSGTRFTVSGAEYRLMNDDSVEAVVADIRGILPA